jgi:pimeloyl-ACP methyl ester carboxylesterase
MLDFLDALEIERFGVVAHDYGALVACAMLELAPECVTHLAVTNTSLRHADWSGSWVSPFSLVRLPLVGELAFSLARPFMLKWAYSLYVAERRKLEGELMDALWEPFEHGFARTLLRLFREARSTPEDFERWRAALAAFEGPALIAWGGKDPTFRADRAVDIAGLLPQAETVVLRGSNHFVQIDRPRSLARLIARLIKRRAVASA